MATIQELESFKLSDAVDFHEELNPRLWDDEKLDPEVRDQLLLIAEDFVEYLGLDNLKVEDVTISGSNAAYSYTPHSDLDLHILVDFNKLPDDPVYQELFTAKKTLYNDLHDISVREVPVELYVQDTNQVNTSLGEYSVVYDKWIRIPKKRRANFDEAATKLKYEKLGDLIELALKTRDPKRVKDTIDLVKRYRKAGLEKAGEFGPENLAFKAIRKQGLIQDLYDLKAELHGEKLSIEENTTPHTFAGKDPMSFKSPNGGTPVMLLVTGQGSRYLVTSDGMVLRNKSFHASTGGEDQGLKDWSGAIEFYDPNEKPGGAPFALTVSKAVEKKLPVALSNTKDGKRALLIHDGKQWRVAKVSDIYNNVASTDDPIIATYSKTPKLNWNVFDYDVDANNRIVRAHPGSPVTHGIQLNQTKQVAENSKPNSNKQAAVLKIQKHLNKKYGANLDLDGKLGPLTLKSINKFMPRAKTGLADEPNKTTAVQGKKVKVDEEITDLRVYKNPSPKQLYGLTQRSSHKHMRGMYHNGDTYWWDGNDAIHKQGSDYLGIPYDYQMRMEAAIDSVSDNYRVGGDDGVPQDIVQKYDIENELVYEASGYIPSEKEKNDPRFKTALTVDVKPNSIKKNAKAFNWKTSRAGIPPQARADGKITEALISYTPDKKFVNEKEEVQYVATTVKDWRIRARIFETIALRNINESTNNYQTIRDRVMRSLVAFSTNKLKIGNNYIPIQINILRDSLLFYDVKGNSPAQEPAEFGTLVELSNDEAKIRINNKLYNYPIHIDSANLMMVTVFLDSAEKYDQLRMMVSLEFEQSLPPLKPAVGELAEDLMREFKTFLSESAPPKLGYHVTATKNLPIIQKDGIKADKRGNSYVWDSREMAEWFMDFQNDEGQDRTILKIDMSGLDANPDPEAEDMSEWSSRFKPGTNGGAWIISGPIPPNKIIG